MGVWKEWNDKGKEERRSKKYNESEFKIQNHTHTHTQTD